MKGIILEMALAVAIVIINVLILVVWLDLSSRLITIVMGSHILAKMIYNRWTPLSEDKI